MIEARLALVASLVLIVACSSGVATTPSPTRTSTVTPTAPIPTSSPTVRPTSTARSSPTPDAPRITFHGERRAALEAATGLGYTCGSEAPLDDGTPAVQCTYSGATEAEGLIVIGPAGDLRGVRLHSDEGDRIGEFLFTFTNDAMTTWVFEQLDELVATGIVPVEVSKSFPGAIMRFEAIDASPILVILTVQAPPV